MTRRPTTTADILSVAKARAVIYWGQEATLAGSSTTRAIDEVIRECSVGYEAESRNTVAVYEALSRAASQSAEYWAREVATRAEVERVFDEAIEMLREDGAG